MSGFSLPPLTGSETPRIARLPQPAPELLPQGGETPRADRPGRFAGVLADAIDHVDGLQKEVQDQVRSAASGEPVALHDIMLSMGKSEAAFNLLLEMRNKLLDAWDKLSRSAV